MAGPEGMRGRELERVERSFLLAAGLSVWCSQENEIRGRLLGGVLSFFWCVNRWTWEEDSRELPSTFLERKREQSEMKISDLHGSVGNGSKRVSWVFFLWESQIRDKGATNKNKEGRKQRSKARMTKGISGAAKKSSKKYLGSFTCIARKERITYLFNF